MCGMLDRLKKLDPLYYVIAGFGVIASVCVAVSYLTWPSHSEKPNAKPVLALRFEPQVKIIYLPPDSEIYSHIKYLQVRLAQEITLAQIQQARLRSANASKTTP